MTNIKSTHFVYFLYHDFVKLFLLTIMTTSLLSEIRWSGEYDWFNKEEKYSFNSGMRYMYMIDLSHEGTQADVIQQGYLII